MDRGPTPPDLSNDLVSFVTPVIYDTPTWNHKFGDCIKQPAEVAKIGETATARFVSVQGDVIQNDVIQVFRIKVCQTAGCYFVRHFQ